MRLLVQPVLVALLIVGATINPVEAQASRSPDHGIEKGTFGSDDQPLWTFSGAWASNEQSFYLVDVLEKSIAQYSLDGNLEMQRRGSELGIKGFRPKFMERIEAKDSSPIFIVQSGKDDVFYQFSEGFKRMGAAQGLRIPREGLRLNGVENAQGQVITGITTWTANKEYLLAFGDLRVGEEDFFSGYMKIPFAAPKTFKIVQRVETNSVDRQRHYLGYSFSAPLPANDQGVEGAVFLMDDPLRVFTTQTPQRQASVESLGEQKIEGLKGYTPSLPWKSWSSRTPTLDKFASLESSSMVTNIVADEKYFYLVRRDGLTWTLEQLERATQKSIGIRDLPTNAAHLVLITGQEKFLFIEKESVIKLGDQQIEHFFTVPYREWFQDN